MRTNAKVRTHIYRDSDARRGSPWDGNATPAGCNHCYVLWCKSALNNYSWYKSADCIRAGYGSLGCRPAVNGTPDRRAVFAQAQADMRLCSLGFGTAKDMWSSLYYRSCPGSPAPGTVIRVRINRVVRDCDSVLILALILILGLIAGILVITG